MGAFVVALIKVALVYIVVTRDARAATLCQSALISKSGATFSFPLHL